jgi:hypothetical protein
MEFNNKIFDLSFQFYNKDRIIKLIKNMTIFVNFHKFYMNYNLI